MVSFAIRALGSQLYPVDLARLLAMQISLIASVPRIIVQKPGERCVKRLGNSVDKIVRKGGTYPYLPSSEVL